EEIIGKFNLVPLRSRVTVDVWTGPPVDDRNISINGYATIATNVPWEKFGAHFVRRSEKCSIHFSDRGVIFSRYKNPASFRRDIQEIYLASIRHEEEKLYPGPTRITGDFSVWAMKNIPGHRFYSFKDFFSSLP